MSLPILAPHQHAVNVVSVVERHMSYSSFTGISFPGVTGLSDFWGPDGAAFSGRTETVQGQGALLSSHPGAASVQSLHTCLEVGLGTPARAEAAGQRTARSQCFFSFLKNKHTFPLCTSNSIYRYFSRKIKTNSQVALYKNVHSKFTTNRPQVSITRILDKEIAMWCICQIKWNKPLHCQWIMSKALCWVNKSDKHYKLYDSIYMNF